MLQNDELANILKVPFSKKSASPTASEWLRFSYTIGGNSDVDYSKKTFIDEILHHRYSKSLCNVENVYCRSKSELIGENRSGEVCAISLLGYSGCIQAAQAQAEYFIKIVVEVDIEADIDPLR